jgi:hypothetical protein
VPADYLIDADRRLLCTSASGTLTLADLVDGRRRLRDDPAFGASYNELFDLRKVEHIALTPADLAALAEHSVLRRGICRAFVVANDAHFELARRFAQLAEFRGQRVLIFRDATVAEAWLVTRQAHGNQRP